MTLKTFIAAVAATVIMTQASVACTLFEVNGQVYCGNPIER